MRGLVRGGDALRGENPPVAPQPVVDLFRRTHPDRETAVSATLSAPSNVKNNPGAVCGLTPANARFIVSSTCPDHETAGSGRIALPDSPTTVYASTPAPTRIPLRNRTAQDPSKELP